MSDPLGAFGGDQWGGGCQQSKQDSAVFSPGHMLLIEVQDAMCMDASLAVCGLCSANCTQGEVWSAVSKVYSPQIVSAHCTLSHQLGLNTVS